MKKSLLLLSYLFSCAIAQDVKLEDILIVDSSDFKYNQSQFYSNSELKTREYLLQETAPGFINPNINGIMGDRLNLTIDNMKFSNGTFRSGPNQYYSWIPSEFTTSIDTNKADTQLNYASVNKELGVEKSGVNINYTSYNNGTTTQGTFKNKNITLSVFDKNYGNVETPTKTVQHSSYNQKGFFGEYISDLGVTKVLATYSGDIDRTDKFEQNKPLIYVDQQYLMLNHNYKSNDYVFKGIISNSSEFIDDISNSLSNHKNSHIKNTLIGGDISKQITSFKIGANVYNENISYQNDKIILIPNYVKFMVDTFSIYGNYYWSKNDFVQKIKLDITRQDFKGPTLTNNTYDSVNAEILSYYNDYMFSLSKSDRNPTLANLAFDMTGVNGTGIPNPNLKAETYKELKIGYDIIKGVQVYSYLTDIDNYIVVRNNINQNINAKLSGIGLKVSQKIGEVYFDGNIQYQEGKTDLDYVDKLVPYYGNAKIEYNGGMIEYLFAAKDNHQSLGDLSDTRIIGHNIGYDIVNLGYKVNFDKHIFSLKAFNIFNQTGRIYGSSVDYYGRSYGIGYTYTF